MALKVPLNRWMRQILDKSHYGSITLWVNPGLVDTSYCFQVRMICYRVVYWLNKATCCYEHSIPLLKEYQSLARVEPLLSPAPTKMMGNLAHAQPSTLTYTPDIKRVLIVKRMSPR
jgi:hypothetical protein